MATTTNLDSLVINYLTQEQYDEAQQAGTLNANQLYLTPDTGNTYGTVTSVGITNAANGGLSISGSPVTSSGSITVGHSNVLSSAQTTQAVYPIKIDKNGHISTYGSAVTIPTKTSDLTNDSGFITSYTDTKNTAGSTNSTSQLYLIGATEQSANPQTYSNNGLYINNEGTLITQSLTSYGSVGFSSGTSEYTFDNSYFYLSTKVYTQEAVSDSVRGAFIGGDYTGLTIGSYKGNNYSDITTYLRVSSEDETVEITNLSAPTTNTDAATKKYVDDLVGAITIPTKTSDLTNDSGFITSYTDEKLKWTASTSSNTYYPLQSTSTATTSTANTLNGISFYQYYNTTGGYRRLDLGNSTAYKSTGGAYGTIRLYGAAATYYGDLVPGVLGTTSGDGHISANRTWTLPDKTGTIALTSDIPSVYSSSNTGGYLTMATLPIYNGTVV